MKISKRLEAVASYVPYGSKIADVGTDHGYIPIWLASQDTILRGIAMDVRTGPLQRAQKNIADYGLEDKIETRLSDGLSALSKGEADTVIIAGMGGELILRILQEGAHVRDSIETFILSPQSELSLFRHGLEGVNLSIDEETMICDEGKFYTIMVVRKGCMHYSREYRYQYGARLIEQKSPVLKSYLEKEQAQLLQIREQLASQGTERSRARIEAVDTALANIKETFYEMQ